MGLAGGGDDGVKGEKIRGSFSENYCGFRTAIKLGQFADHPWLAAGRQQHLLFFGETGRGEIRIPASGKRPAVCLIDRPAASLVLFVVDREADDVMAAVAELGERTADGFDGGGGGGRLFERPEEGEAFVPGLEGKTFGGVDRR